MNKADLIEKVFAEQGPKVSKAQAARALESVISGITASLKKGERVTISGFGTFSASKRKARVGRNPQTGEPISIPARTVARFTPGKELRRELEKNY
ncbi:MAG TPA: HU family DNA-binding protein [Candidatus Polarisedimenticolia bacterium]|nr:HU family DNA-binding protein [Candidatus Polarisedimenticolia bacterium]